MLILVSNRIMTSLVKNRKRVWCFLGIGGMSSSNQYDRLPILDDENVNREHGELDGWERIRLMYHKTENGSYSPEFNDISNVTLFAYLTGFVLGGYVDSKTALERFISENKHELFRHPRDAQRKMQERVFVEFFRGGLRTGFKLAVITVVYVTFTTSLSCYRNYIAPLDHSIVGVALGSLYKLWSGPKAMVSGGFIGGSLGTLCGTLTWLLQYLSGETVEERWQREFRQIALLERKNLELLRQEQQKTNVRAVWSYNEVMKDNVDKDLNEEGIWHSSVRNLVTKLRELF